MYVFLRQLPTSQAKLSFFRLVILVFCCGHPLLHYFLFQFGFRALTFVINAILLRIITQDLLGVVNVR